MHRNLYALRITLYWQRGARCTILSSRWPKVILSEFKRLSDAVLQLPGPLIHIATNCATLPIAAILSRGLRRRRRHHVTKLNLLGADCWRSCCPRFSVCAGPLLQVLTRSLGMAASGSASTKA